MRASSQGSAPTYSVSNAIAPNSFGVATEEPASEDQGHTAGEHMWIAVNNGTILGRKTRSITPQVGYFGEDRYIAQNTSTTGTDGQWVWGWDTFGQNHDNYSVFTRGEKQEYNTG